MPVMDGWRVSRRSLEPNDLLLLYTDGLTEACRETSDQLGEGRLKETLAKRRNGSPRLIIDEVFREMQQFCGGTPDGDVTLLAVKRKVKRSG